MAKKQLSSLRTTDSKSHQEETDLDPILIPIPGNSGEGVSLRYDGIYDKIREARREDDPALPQGIWKKTLKKADFKEIEKLACDALIHQSKDFQLMAWLIESWLELYHLKGLNRGLKLMNGLTIRFWDQGFPKIEGEDTGYRMAPFHWMNEKLSDRISEVKITQSSEYDASTYSFSDWRTALALEKLAQKVDGSDFLNQAQSEGRPILQVVQDAINHSSLSFYKDLRTEISLSLQEIETLENFLDQKFTQTDISLYQLRRSLKDIVDLVGQFILEKQETFLGETSSSLSGQGTPSSGKNDSQKDGEKIKEQDAMMRAFDTVKTALSTKNKISKRQENTSKARSKKLTVLPKLSTQNPIQSREEAYALLKLIQDFLMRTEPHSPAPYLIKRTLSWGNMNLEDVFGEVLQETGDLNQLLTLLGMHKPTP